MKLLFCDNTIWGLINFREAVFRHFHEQGYEIVLVAPSDEKTRMKTVVPDYVRFVPVYLERAGRNPLTDVSYLLCLLRIYQRERPDWIFHYTIKPNIYGTLAARLLGIRSVAMVAGLGYTFAKQGLTGSIARALSRFALRYACRVFVLNEENLNTLITHHIASAAKLVLLKSGEGVDTELLQEGKIEKYDRRTTFLMVARVLYDKGYTEFVEAAQLLKTKGVNADFCLLGPIDECYPNAVGQEIIDADVIAGRIRYLGFSTQPLNIMRQPGTVIVLPSYHEGMNRSLMEACALGKPIITTDIPGCREIVEEGKNGFVIPTKNSEALAAAMMKYLELDGTQKIQMGHESRRVAIERYDIRYVIMEYEKIIGMSELLQ